MKLLGLCLALSLVIGGAKCFLYPHSDNLGYPKGRNGGLSCAACSLLVSLVEQLVEVNNSSAVHTLDYLCNLMPPEVAQPCREAVSVLGPPLIKLIAHEYGPDVTCHALTFCYTDPGAPTCKTITPPFESTKLPFETRVKNAKYLIEEEMQQFLSFKNICDVPGISFVCEWINSTYSNRKPLVDFDQDGFSPSMSFRGSGWRGKDCSDLSVNVHPGRKASGGDLYYDSNCNGISGINNVTKQSYEDEFCSLSQPRGVAVLGDSIGAHAGIPSVWIDATEISKEALKLLPFVVLDEIDWPMLGSYTGHGSNKWTEVIKGPVDSIYKRMFERNRCIHRDYQNVAVNGGDSFNVHKAMKRLSRDRTTDHPLIVFLVLVGNDICQGKSQSVDNMTTPEEMHKNTLETLAYLNERLPAGSSVLIEALADGRILYEYMANRIHPVGHFWHKFTYSDFYDYMNCMQISPCPTWLTSNATNRERGAKRVVELNKVLMDIVGQKKSHYSNFNLYFLEDPVAKVLKDWKDEGNEPWQLVELADGFHSNTAAQALTAKVLWDDILTNFPEVLGPVNPHNAQIKKLFGDQGGF